jgi:hypothetical protein
MDRPSRRGQVLRLVVIAVLVTVAAFTVLRVDGSQLSAVTESDAAKSAMVLSETPVAREPLGKVSLPDLSRWPGWTALTPILLLLVALGGALHAAALAPATHPVRRRAPPLA